MRTIKRKCAHPGCNAVVERGRCDRHDARPEVRPLDRRGNAASRGYDRAWSNLAERYRQYHPLCVMCLVRGRVNPATCVDHIIPVRCCPTLRLEWDNLQASCTRCNWKKAQTDPETQWEPRDDRIVVCGLPGTGKTTFAKTTGLPYWDADEYDMDTIEDVQREREQWIRSQGNNGYCVIVASTVTASQLAASIKGIVKHMADVYVTREPSQYRKGGT